MRIPLDRPWTLSYEALEDGERKTIPARVPGNVLGDLQRADVIPDPYYADNSDRLRPYEFLDWEYGTVFPSPELRPDQRAWLVFEGIDTVAEIRLNGTEAGRADNMFIPHRYDVTERLAPAGALNELRVAIASSVNHARQFPRPAFLSTQPYNYESLHLRRARHTYGWDIFPRLVGAGLWRPAYLEILEPRRWTDLYLATTAVEDENDRARLTLHWSFTAPDRSLDGFGAELVMRCGDSEFRKRFVPRFVTGKLDFHLEHPKLWHPAGAGRPHLYDVTLTLYHFDDIVDVRSWSTGVRTIDLDRTDVLEPDGGGKFVFVVNNKPVFIKGSNWVPANAVHGEAPERREKALDLFRDLGCNMVRCWGGGVYEDQAFFDYCDRHGLLVWQDFMFACETPPQDAAFLEAVRKEAESVVQNLRNHASLALWCGDNECDELSFWSATNRKVPPSYNKVSREVLRDAVLRFDPVRDYLPSSPYLDDLIWRRNERYRSPEQHLWGPRDNWKGRFYQHHSAVFASEIGYHGLPSPKSLARFLSPSSLNGRVGDREWNCHAAQPFGDLEGAYSYRTRLFLDQAKGCFGDLPESLPRLARYSQIVQAEAMKFFVEQFRMNKWKRTGLIWWNVIDGWPQVSDAVVDYYYARKLAYHYLKNSQQPLLLAMGEPDGWHCPLVVSNDAPHPARGGYAVRDLATGETLREGTFAVAADAVAELPPLRVCQGQHRMHLLEWTVDGTKYHNHYLLGAAPFRYEAYAAWLAKLRVLLYPDWDANPDL